MQYQVPQNIDLEDKIIGPLTLKQFIILLVGGMFDYMWYTFFDIALFVLLMIPTTLFTLALVFAKVQEEPFPKFLVNFFLFTLKPKILTWGQTLKPKIIETKKIKKEKITPKVTSGSEIEKLSRIVDTQGWSGPSASMPPKPTVPAITPLSPIPKIKPKQSLIDKIIGEKQKTPANRTVIPKISQPQPVKTPYSKRVATTQKPAQPVISESEVRKVAQDIGKKENAPKEKIEKAVKEILEKLKTTPPEQIKPKEAFWKKVISKLSNKPSGRKVIQSQVVTPEELEKELGLANRVKTHARIRPKLNLGPASESNPEDPLDKSGV